jgi:3-isopropylmalate dehydrogenase
LHPEWYFVFKIGVIAGDGVGPEVVREGVETLELVARTCGFQVETVPFDLGGERYLRTGEVLPPSEKEAVRACDAVILGAVGTPKVPPGVLERGLLLDLRFSFRQCINLRPIKLYPGVDTPVKNATPEKIDMVVVRENNEDLYVGAGGFTYKGTPEEVAIQTSINTRFGVDRVLRYAFDLARRRGAGRVFPGLSEAEKKAGKIGRVTMVAKTNVLTYAHDLWQRAFNEIAAGYPDIKTDYNHVDACCMRMVVAFRTLRRDRHDQHVRRHHHRPGCRAPGRHGCRGLGQPQPGQRQPPACSSRYTARHPTSPARGSPTRSRHA